MDMWQNSEDFGEYSQPRCIFAATKSQAVGNAKNKLLKYAEFEAFSNCYDYRHELKGKWNTVFGNDNPIVLELACGKGDYALGLSQLEPGRNYIGVDVKGNRLWAGAKKALENGWNHVAFLRIEIDRLADFFAPGEVEELWITFPDPQPRKMRKRLTSYKFLNIYRQVMGPSGKVHLKSDSHLFWQSTLDQVAQDGLRIVEQFDDVYAMNPLPPRMQIQTFYEKIWLLNGKTIRYVQFEIGSTESLPLPERDEDRSEFFQDRGARRI
jgi:tRNA (guanine-N7-)-methyltransferase